MNEKSIFRLAIAAAIVQAIVGAALVGGAVWAAIHFIGKYW